MKWFDNWFAKKCEEWRRSENNKKELRAMGDESRYIRNSLSVSGLSFSLYTANGGHVVEVNHRHNSPHVNSGEMASLYIIPADKDLGEGISQIFTLELLKR